MEGERTEAVRSRPVLLVGTGVLSALIIVHLAHASAFRRRQRAGQAAAALPTHRHRLLGTCGEMSAPCLTSICKCGPWELA